MGIKNCAWRLFSNNSGIRPNTVVAVVRKTGRSRSDTASSSASRNGRLRAYSSMVVTRTIESLMMMPLLVLPPRSVQRSSMMLSKSPRSLRRRMRPCGRRGVFPKSCGQEGNPCQSIYENGNSHIMPAVAAPQRRLLRTDCRPMVWTCHHQRRPFGSQMRENGPVPYPREWWPSVTIT